MDHTVDSNTTDVRIRRNDTIYKQLEKETEAIRKKFKAEVEKKINRTTILNELEDHHLKGTFPRWLGTILQPQVPKSEEDNFKIKFNDIMLRARREIQAEIIATRKRDLSTIDSNLEKIKEEGKNQIKNLLQHLVSTKIISDSTANMIGMNSYEELIISLRKIQDNEELKKALVTYKKKQANEKSAMDEVMNEVSAAANPTTRENSDVAKLRKEVATLSRTIKKMQPQPVNKKTNSTKKPSTMSPTDGEPKENNQPKGKGKKKIQPSTGKSNPKINKTKAKGKGKSATSGGGK